MRPTLEEKKSAARQNYINARDAWAETRSKETPNGDNASWVALCDAKRLCRQFGVIV